MTYQCRNCQKPIEIKPTDKPISVTKGNGGKKIYMVSCPHCGTKNRFTVPSR